MTAGGSVVDRITAVQRAHDFIPHAMRCRCGWFYGDGSHAAHVAGEVAKALQLAEEWGWQLGDHHPNQHATREEAQARVDELDAMFKTHPDSRRYSALPRQVVSRLVFPWVPVPQQGDQ